MFRSLFKSRTPPAAVPMADGLPEGVIVWAIGDIHGRLDLLKTLLGTVVPDLEESNASRRCIVFLGDYIDRGPDSKGVIDHLCRLDDQQAFECHFLRGNHEDRMEAFLIDPEVGPGWCDYGGREALRSYGVTPPLMREDKEAWATASRELAIAMPARHREFLARQESSFTISPYFFAHAGARPGVRLDEQDANDLMWLRQPFLDHPAPFDQVVVHGHTPTEAVYADHRRIGIDTGAYATGMLTGLRLQGLNREIAQTHQLGRTLRVECLAL